MEGPCTDQDVRDSARLESTRIGPSDVLAPSDITTKEDADITRDQRSEFPSTASHSATTTAGPG